MPLPPASLGRSIALLSLSLLATLGWTLGACTPSPKKETPSPASKTTSDPRVVPSPPAETPGAGGGTVFTGAWFSVEIPEGFTVRPGLPSTSSTEGVESARFLSPDSSVEFYVFAPQWTGEATDIAIDPSTEREVRRTVRGSEEGRKEMAWTIVAKDGSSQRSYQEIRENGGMRIIGLRTTSKSASDRYRQHYLAFKSSLRQFAD